MATDHSTIKPHKAEIVRSGAVGASGGTAIVLLANKLPNGNIWKEWLLLAAPSISLAVAAAWAWLQVELTSFLQEFKFRRVLSSAIRNMHARLAAPSLNEAQRKQIESYIAELELMGVTREYTKVKTLEIDIRPRSSRDRKKSPELPRRLRNSRNSGAA